MTAVRPGGNPQRIIELLWGFATPGSRGPRPRLDLPRIVDAAVTVADTEGLSAVSMRRVAEELDVTTMSLYRYVPGKDVLLELMFDAGCGRPPDARHWPKSWRAALEYWAKNVRAAFRARPWLLQVPVNGPPMGPNNFAWMEALLAPLEETGLTADDMLYVLLMLTVYVRGEAQLAFGLSQAEERTGVSERERAEAYSRLMGEMLDSERYPALARIAASGIFELAEDDQDADFEFGLSRILDGVEALVHVRRADGSPTLAR